MTAQGVPSPSAGASSGTAGIDARNAPALQASWRGLYRTGAWAAVMYVALVVAPLGLLAAAPVPPSSGAAVLDYIGDHRTVYLAELVCFVGLSIPALVVFAAWAVAVRHIDPGLALLGGLFGVGSEITALAVGSSPQSLNGGLVILSDAYRSSTGADQRAGLAHAADAVVATTNAMPWAGVLTAAAILVLSLAMWSGPFPKALAAVGIVTGALGLLAETFRPIIGPLYLVYGLLLPTWFALIGWRLHLLAPQETPAPPPMVRTVGEVAAVDTTNAPPVQ